MITLFDSENADRDLTSLVTCLTHTPSASKHTRCQGLFFFGDGSDDLDGSGGDFEFVVTVGGQTVQPSPETVHFGTEVRSSAPTTSFPVPANAEVILRAKSPNGADTDVDVTAYLYQASTEEVDLVKYLGNACPAADTAGYPKVTNKTGTGTGEINLTNGEVEVNENNDKTGYGLADDAITAAKFDESTAYPLGSADTGATEVARTGADSDTLETLSDQVDGCSTHTAAAVWAVGTRTLTSFGTLVADIWDALTSGMTQAGSLGKKLADWVLGTDSKVLISADAQDLSGTLDVNTKSLTAGAVDAAAIADNAIDAGALATDCITADAIADDAIDAGALAGDLNVYSAYCRLERDDTNAVDRYSVGFLTNGVHLTAGVTNGKLTVQIPSEGTPLIDDEDLTDDGDHEFSYAAEGDERQTLGLLYLATVSATIDAATRTFKIPVGRDAP